MSQKVPTLQQYTVKLRGTDECNTPAGHLARERAITLERDHPVIYNSVQLKDLLDDLGKEVKEISAELGVMITNKPHGVTYSCHDGWRVIFILDIDVKEK